MIFNLIGTIMNIILLLGIFIGIIYGGLFLIKERLIKKKRKREVQQINKIQLKIKEITSLCFRWFVNFFRILITMVISVLLAMGLKPIIYKLNYSLGEGYSTFASYVIAICLYILLSPRLTPVNANTEVSDE